MKKNLSILLIMFALGANVFSSEMLEASKFDLKAGWNRSSLKQEGMDYPTFNMWKFAGSYIYQEPDLMYLRSGFAYSSGNKEKAGVKYKAKAWDFEFGAGWTFALGQKAMLSPFVSVGHNSFTIKSSQEKSYETCEIGNTIFNPQDPFANPVSSVNSVTKDYTLIKNDKYSGFYGKAGIDLTFQVSENLSTGLVASVGMPFRNKLRLTTEESGKDYGQTTKKTVKLKEKLFYELAIPVSYHVDEWDVGLELSYAHHVYQAADDKEGKNKLTKNDLGIAFTAGMTF